MTAPPKVLILSTSLLTDRAILYSGLLPALRREVEPVIWAASFQGGAQHRVWGSSGVRVEPFPEVASLPALPHGYLRRVNDFVWDVATPSTSRDSMRKHVRDAQTPWWLGIARFPAWLIARMQLAETYEKAVESLIVSYSRSPEAARRLEKLRPDLIVSTSPFFYFEPPVIGEARRLGIPTQAFVTSWDNITTKNRMLLRYDSYLLWSERMRDELHEFYPYTRRCPAEIVGAPQFDVFFRRQLAVSRETFCASEALDPARPFILHCLGSPNFLREQPVAERLAQHVADGAYGDVQLLIRPHPIQDYSGLECFHRYGERVRLQRTAHNGQLRHERTQDEQQVASWVNTFRHSSVVVNLASSVVLDAAFFDKPVINICFDGEAGSPHQALIEDVNRNWRHFRPVFESGAVVNAFSESDLHSRIRECLADPAAGAEARRRLLQEICGYADGNSGERFARGVMQRVSAPRVSQEVGV
ncbi:MAG: hypothetical protein K2X35_13655 [Bryobacteraceae bacterium]|nr:hypothetical protein [Bryobacteraceae bacterium]